MLRRKQEINQQIQQIIDAVLLVLAFWGAYALRVAATDWFRVEPIPPFKEFLWMIVVIMPCGPLMLELQGFYEHPLQKQIGRTLAQLGRALVGLALLVGLLGAVELGPLITMALLGGAIADRMDRRKLLALDQIGVFLAAGGLAAAALIGHPAVATLYVLGGLLAGFAALQSVAQSAIIPNLVDRERLAAARARHYGRSPRTQVRGPGLLSPRGGQRR